MADCPFGCVQVSRAVGAALAGSLGAGGSQGRGGGSELLVCNYEAGFLSLGTEFLAKGGFSMLLDHGDHGRSFGELAQGPCCCVLGRWGRGES